MGKGRFPAPFIDLGIRLGLGIRCQEQWVWYGSFLSLLVALGGATLESAGHVCQGWELGQVISWDNKFERRSHGEIRTGVNEGFKGCSVPEQGMRLGD